MSREVVIISYLSNYGGIETFVLRMAKWLNKNNFTFTIITDKEREVDSNLYSELAAHARVIHKISFRKYDSELQDFKLYSDDVLILSFAFPSFLLGEEIKKNNYLKKRVQNVFYDPHQYGLMMDKWTKYKLIKGVFKKLSKFLVTRMNENHSIIYMDKLCKQRTINDFEIPDYFSDDKDVQLLPIEILELDYDKINTKVDANEFNILTIARVVFPFKGYIIGLIDLFVKLKAKHKNITLTIVGSGISNEILERKILELDKSIQMDIKWIKGVDYCELNKYFDKANVYVGMGTTVLDAVNSGVPSIPIGSYTYDCKGYDFFNKDYINLGGISGKIGIYDLLEKVYFEKKNEYIQHLVKDHNTLRKHYDEDTIFRTFLDLENSGEKRVLSSLEMSVYRKVKRIYGVTQKNKSNNIKKN